MKSVQQGLKELLKTHEPWAREVEFQRKNLRRLYLRLLLIYPYAKESNDVETHLWMQTSYQFISQYRQRISTLERVVHGPPPRNGHNRHVQYQQGGPVEYRKLLGRFRQFLAEEERFWIQLVLRFRRAFRLTEAQPALSSLGIAQGDEEAPAGDANNPPLAQGGRNNLGFPPDDPAIDVAPQKPEQRRGQLFILSKALVCLGDLARYKELYNDSGGRPRAGHEDGPVAAPRGRGGKGAQQMPARERNYEKAQRYYEQARALVPDEGNPSHQLAILAMYKKDTFGSLVHYYKALCVQQPYDPATENLATVLNKALEMWRKTTEKPSSTEPRHRVAAFKNDVLVLHALWRLGVEETMAAGPKHAEQLLVDFGNLMSDRVLPIETIRDVVMLAQGALLKHRKFRDPPVSGHRRSKSIGQDHPRTASASTIESQIATHVMALHRTLMEIGAAEVAEKPPEDAAEGDLAQKITAVFRRMLPALRIAGKWLRANIGYVTQRSTPKVPRERESDGQDRRKGRSTSVLISDMDDFWAVYTRFMSALLRTFPVEKLPALAASLEEDVDLAGFIPLKRLLVDRGRAPVGGDEVHPNDEQLMRIADILRDAQSVADITESPVILKEGRFIFGARISGGASSNGVFANGVADASEVAVTTVDETIELVDEDDIMAETMTDVTRTDDDPVREAGDAFRKGLRNSTSDLGVDDEDEIVWNPRPALSPIAKPTLSPIGPAKTAALPLPPALPYHSPARPNFGVIGAPQSPRLPQESRAITPPKTGPTSGTTAQDLLNRIRTAPVSKAQVQAEPLFGIGSRPSIWSAGTNATPKYAVLGSTAFNNQQYYSSQQPPSSLDNVPSQSLAQSVYALPSQTPQNGLAGAGSTSPFATPPQLPIGGGHHRVASASMLSPQQLNQVGNLAPWHNMSTLGFHEQPQAFGHSRGTSLGSHLGPAGFPSYRDEFESQLYPGPPQPRPLSNIWGNT
ncbi:hypothetical protein NEOLEDRAFT_1157531 [Neolentinus lepideus HHB14362 ss-1]|uniref:Protein SMG7 n=1 Tax=Neolentinus lepideus HHB14362 ss-1 TaxID=1314782 RepID=A0A165QVJ7_9AGAM|nr:hypothetical protein NEOLEDRAFT_1157531 [Neolentinus lepideus HHB14362 ss-1]